MSITDNIKGMKLTHPPVVMAIFQIGFNHIDSDLTSFLEFDSVIKHYFPKRSNQIQANVGVSSTLVEGISKITSKSDAKLTGFNYSTDDDKQKLIYDEGFLTYVNELEYEGWDNFKQIVSHYLKMLSPFLEKHTIKRVSIRFINKFSLTEFEDPTVYFKTMVSTTEDGGFSYPLIRYAFRLRFTIPETERYAIVNQDLENVSTDKYDYIFDIDVLDKRNHIFDHQSILETMEELRVIKNTIFFENITQKSIDLCN